MRTEDAKTYVAEMLNDLISDTVELRNYINYMTNADHNLDTLFQLLSIVAVGTEGQTADNSEPTNDAVFIFLYPMSVFLSFGLSIHRMSPPSGLMTNGIN